MTGLGMWRWLLCNNIMRRRAKARARVAWTLFKRPKGLKGLSNKEIGKRVQTYMVEAFEALHRHAEIGSWLSLFGEDTGLRLSEID
jgi:hypothetical protein